MQFMFHRIVVISMVQPLDDRNSNCHNREKKYVIKAAAAAAATNIRYANNLMLMPSHTTSIIVA